MNITQEQSQESEQIDFFTIVPNEVLDSGFTVPMLVTMLWLHRRADWKTGRVKWVTAEVIANQLNAIPHEASSKEIEHIRRQFQRAMKNLEQCGWITRHVEKGQKGWYWVTLHNYVARSIAPSGAVTRQVLNLKQTVPYKGERPEPCAQPCAEPCADSSTIREPKNLDLQEPKLREPEPTSTRIVLSRKIDEVSTQDIHSPVRQRVAGAAVPSLKIDSEISKASGASPSAPRPRLTQQAYLEIVRASRGAE